eukprot:scaffold4687_cov117-Isochrysis_galbana.AAC.4
MLRWAEARLAPRVLVDFAQSPGGGWECGGGRSCYADGRLLGRGLARPGLDGRTWRSKRGNRGLSSLIGLHHGLGGSCRRALPHKKLVASRWAGEAAGTREGISALLVST